MRINKAASIPLVLHDPYFSIWSGADHLYDTDPVHWSQARQQLRGYVTVDGTVYCFLGDREFHNVIEQTYIDVTATATEYGFENEKIALKVRFTSPLILDDLTLVSRPCTYIDYTVEKKNACQVTVDFLASADLVTVKDDMLYGNCHTKAAQGNHPAFTYASMGRAFQHPLGNSGDHITIDWGYAYLASTEESAVLSYDKANKKLCCCLDLTDKDRAGMIIAYDDLLSINYFGQWRKAYWTNVYSDILDAIGASFADKKEVLEKAAKVDAEVYEKAFAVGGESYAFLCNFSYRHSIAAHKLITDDKGEVMFLSKENDSNGCIGTVDVSYPSIPLYLMYNTEFVKGMMRPVLDFASREVWEYDFAPHDVGRYPYAWGQVYGLHADGYQNAFVYDNGAVYQPYYMFPAGSNVYDFKYQMPVEECGNMLVMAATVSQLDGNTDFIAPYMEVMKQWTQYLLTYGADPGEQLCTDDFAGHLAHNVNLSAKAIVGIEAYAKLAAMMGWEEEAAQYHEKAKEMAASLEERAKADDHYALCFGSPETWSMKYNMVWDKFFGSGLFSDEIYEKEYAYYIKKTNEFGTPLDSRREYTKSDWILWCAAMAENKADAKKLIDPVAHYLENTSTRVPFSDWYETVTGKFCHFMGRSVQGGIFMPMLMKEKGAK